MALCISGSGGTGLYRTTRFLILPGQVCGTILCWKTWISYCIPVAPFTVVFIVRTAKMPFPVTWKTQALLSSILKTRISPPPERVSVTFELGRYIPVGACSMLPLYWLRVLNHESFIPISPPRSMKYLFFC